jgi:autotransporter-associated beta strand protein
LIFGADNTVGSGLGDVLTDNLTIGGTNAWTFTNLTFTAGAPAYTIAPGTTAGQGPGAGFTLGTASAATVINQNSGNAQTINDVLRLGAANQTISLASGNLLLGNLISGTGGIVLNANGETGILTLTNNAAETYTGPTIVGGGQFNLGPFPNAGTGGIAHSSGLIISNNATAVTFSDNALAGSAATLGSLPVTINGGTLTSQGTTDSSHLRGLLTLNGGTLADGGTGAQAAFGTWDLDDGVAVGGTATAIISANDVIPDQAGGTIFNVAVTGGSPDLDVQGTLINGTGTHDTGIIKQGPGIMQLDVVNTYAGPTTISAGTLTINSGALLGGAAGAYAGLITNNGTLSYNNSSAAQTFSGAITGTGAINLNSGTLTLAGANTYSGPTAVASGANLVVVSGGASLSPITVNAGATFIENVPTAGGQWNLTNNLTFIDNNPALVMNFSNTLSSTAAALNVHGNFNFSSSLSLTLNGVALIPTGTYPLIAWTGTSSGTAPTTANANVTINLVGVTATVVQTGKAINLVVSSGTGPISWNTGSGVWNTTAPNWLGGLYKDGDAVTFPDTAASSPITVTLNSTVVPSAVTFTNSAKNYILSGTGGIGGGTGLTAEGSGSLTLSTANTYSGPTTVSNGTLTLDFTQPAAPAANIISPASALTLGNATINVLGSAAASSSQTFASTTLAAGNALIQFGNNNPALALGPITVAKGATVVIPVTGGTVSSSVAGGAAGNVLGTGVGANDTAGYATFGAADWASTTGGTIQGLTSGAGYVTTMGGTGQGQNLDLQADYTATANVGTTTLRFNTPGVDTVNVGGKWIVVNAILVTPNMGADNTFIWSGTGAFGGGQYFADYSTGNAQQFYLWQNNTNAYFFDNGALCNGRNNSGAPLAFIQSGPGTVVRGPCLYTGLSYLNGGYTVVTNDAGLGVAATAAPVVMSGGTIVGGSTVSSNTLAVSLDNGGLNPRPLQLLNQGGGLAAIAGNSLTVDGVISGGTGPLVIGIPASAANGYVAGLLPGSGAGTANTNPVYATGTVKLTGANSYTGGTVLDGGVLNLGGASLGTGGVTFNGGTLQWNSASPDISAQTVTINSGGATLDVNAQTINLAGSIGNGGAGALTVTNSGAPGLGGLFLKGGNSYTGGTLVTAGAVLGGASVISGNVTWNTGSYAVLSSAALLTVSGQVTLHNPTVNVTASGLTAGVYTLLTATGGITGGSTVNSVPGGAGVVATGYAGVVSISGNSIILTVTQTGVTETWTDGGGDQFWSNAANWNGGFVPHRPGDVATFGTGGVGLPVNLNQNETVGGIAFANANSYAISGAGTLTLDGSGLGAALNVTAGTTNAIATAVNLNDNVTATVNSGDSLILGGAIANVSGPETLTVNGGGTLALTHANSFGPTAGTVGTTLAGATVQVGNNTALGAGDVSVTGSSTLQAGAPGVTLANNISVANANTLSVAGNGNFLTLGGVISGNGSLTGAGTGTVALNGANSYAGGTVLNAGVIGIAADGAAAGNSGSLGVVPALSAPNNILFNGGDLFGSATLTLNPNRGLGIGSASIANSAVTTAMIDAAAGQTLTVAGTIASAGNIGTNNLTVNSQSGGTGTVVLSAPNTFNGTNIIAGGVEQLGHALALQDSTLFYNNQGGVLSFGSLSAATLNGLLGSQNLALANAAGAAVALTIGNNNASGVFSGNLSGPGSLIMQGSGTEILSDATYAGGTVVEAGNLIFNRPAIFGGRLDLSGVVQYGYAANVVINGGSLTSTNGISILSDTGYTATSGVYNNLCTLTVSNNAIVTAEADATGRAITFGTGNARPGIGNYLAVGTGSGDHTLVVANGALDMFYSSGGSTVGNCAVDLNSGALVVNQIQQTTGGGNQTATINFNGGVLVAGTNDPTGGRLPARTHLPDGERDECLRSGVH